MVEKTQRTDSECVRALLDAQRTSQLSPRLRQTLDGLLDGASEKEVAARLGVSSATVHQYVTSLYRRFGVRSRAALLASALGVCAANVSDASLNEPPLAVASVALSRRLRQTLDSLLVGANEKEVAARLGVSPATVHQYVTSLYRRFGVRSRPQLLAHVLRLRVNANENASHAPSV